MTMRDRHPRAWIPALALALAGCAGLDLSKEYPEKRRYLLEARREPAEREPLPGSLMVQRFTSSPGYQSLGLAYRQPDGTLVEDYYNELAAPASQQVFENTALWLQRSGLFSFVYGPGAHPSPAFVLEGHLVALFGDYRVDGEYRAVLETQFLVTREGPIPEPLFHVGYRREVPIEDTGPRTLVEGWNEALAETLELLESDLEEEISSRTAEE